MARKGVLSPEKKDSAACLMGETDPTLKAELDRQFVRSRTQEAILSETLSVEIKDEDGYSENDRQMIMAYLAFGDLPLIVLTRGAARKHPARSQESFDRTEAIWKAGYERLARYSAVGESITGPNSAHAIQLEQPQAVISAIRKVVENIRTIANRP
jgi:hypothetical protein